MIEGFEASASMNTKMAVFVTANFLPVRATLHVLKVFRVHGER